MATDEAARHGLYNRLTEVLGEDHSDTLMQHLPPTGWGDVARTRDVEAARIATTRDLDLFRAELHADMAGLSQELRGEMGALRDELRGEMGALRDELRGEMGALRDELRGEMGELRSDFGGLRIDIANQLRQQTFAMLGAMVTLTGVTAAAATLI